jgi:hypothetical protein
VPLLFVGINPRVSDSNEWLHQWLQDDYRNFRSLADNRVGGEPYIGEPGQERHYRAHQKIASAAFPGEAFEGVAAVTELHLCATEASPGARPDSVRCAELFLQRVLQLIQPRVVVAVGRTVARYLGVSDDQGGRGTSTVRWQGGTALVVEMPHPNARGPRLAGMLETQRHVRAQLGSSGKSRGRVIRRRKGRADIVVTSPAPAGETTRALGAPGRQHRDVGVRHRERRRSGGRVVRKVSCYWQDRYGWRPHQKAEHLRECAAADGAVIRFNLIRGGQVRFVLEMTADQWRRALGDYATGENWQRYGLVTKLTRTVQGQPTEEFLDRWAGCVRKP